MGLTKRRFVVQEIVECPDCGGKGSTKAHSYNGEGRLVTYDKPCKRCQEGGYVYTVVKLEDALDEMGVEWRRS